MHIEELPTDCILYIAFFLSISDVSKFSRSIKIFLNAIWNNETFWKFRFTNDRKSQISELGKRKRDQVVWRDMYFYCLSLWTFSYNGMFDLRRFPILYVQQISSMNVRSALIDLNNNLWTFEVDSDIEDLKKVPDLKAKLVSCGTNHTIIIDVDNNIWTFGSNHWGQLGYSTNGISPVPKQIKNLKAKQIAAGQNHTLIVDLEDNVWTCGSNKDGQLGIAGKNRICKPVQIPDIKAKMIAAGWEHSVILDFEGNVWTFGKSISGCLGHSYQKTFTPTKIKNLRAKAISASTHITAAIDLKGDVWIFGGHYNNSFNFPTDIQQIPGLNAKQISCGRRSALVIADNDDTWMFGYFCGHRIKQTLTAFKTEQFEYRTEPTKILGVKSKQVLIGDNISAIIVDRFV